MTPRRWWSQDRPGPVGGHVRPDRDEWLDRMAVRGLYRIIMAAIVSIAALSGVGVLMRAVVIDADRLALNTADEALSILGNIAAASVGGLVGWLTRATLDARPPADEDPATPTGLDDDDTPEVV